MGGRQGGSSSSSNSTSRAVPMDHILVDWRGDEGRAITVIRGEGTSLRKREDELLKY